VLRQLSRHINSLLRKKFAETKKPRVSHNQKRSSQPSQPSPSPPSPPSDAALDLLKKIQKRSASFTQPTIEVIPSPPIYQPSSSSPSPVVLSLPDSAVEPICNNVNDYNDEQSLRTKARKILRSYGLRMSNVFFSPSSEARLPCNCPYASSGVCIAPKELPFEYSCDRELLDFLDLEFEPHRFPRGVPVPTYEAQITDLLRLTAKYAEIVF